MAVLKSNSEGLVPVEQSQEIVQGVVKGSAVMRLSRLEEMTSSKKVISVAEGVNAFYVGENEKITSSDQAKFRPVELNAKKLAIIVPFSNEMLNESIVDVIQELQPQITEQMHRKFDQVAIANLIAKITVSGNHIAEGATAGQALYGDVSDVMALIEANGYDVNGFLAHHGFKNRVRKMVDGNGNALYLPKGVAGESDEFYGAPIGYNFGVDKATHELVAGDFNYSVVGIQGEMRFKLLQEATVGGLNLAENDMSAMRILLPVAHAITKNDAFSALTPKA